MLFVLFLLCAFVFAKRLGLLYRYELLVNLLAISIIVVFVYFELIVFNNSDLFKLSDEVFFLELAEFNYDYLFDRHSRYFLYAAYSKLNAATFGSSFLKVQNIPFSLAIALLVYKLSNRRASLLFFPLVFGYIYVLSISNLRDSMLILLVLLYVVVLKNASVLKSLILTIFISLLFMYIRPEYAIVIVISWAILMVCRMIPSRFVWKSLVAVASIFVTGYLALPHWVLDLSDAVYPERVSGYLAERDESEINVSFIGPNGGALIRQILTPFPPSKLMMLITNPEFTDNLVITEATRIVLLSIFYFLMIYCMINYRHISRVMGDRADLQILFTISVVVSILYALYGAGGGDSRNKLFPYLFTYVLAFNIIGEKLKYRNNNSKSFELLAEVRKSPVSLPDAT
jgi:hypothetical protein